MIKPVPTNSVLIPDSAKLMFEGVLFDVYQWQQNLYDQSQATYEMLKRCDTVSAICIVEDKIIVLNEDDPHSGRHVSFPGGKVETSDRTIIEAGQREVKEETGYSFHNWRLVKVNQPSSEIEWFAYLIIAWGVKDKTAPDLDSGEKISVNLMDFNIVKKMALSRAGHISHQGDIFEVVTSLEELKVIPEFRGQEVDR